MKKADCERSVREGVFISKRARVCVRACVRACVCVYCVFSPCLEADERVLNAPLVVLDHVLMHVRVVLPDVSLGAPVGNRPEAERRGEGVRALEL